MRELGEIPLGRLAEQVQAALLRLHLTLTGETHRLLSGLAGDLRVLLVERAGADGVVDEIEGLQLMPAIGEMWREVFGRWQGMLEAGRREAVLLAWGGLARQHQGMVGLAVEEARRWEEQEEGPSPVFEPQLGAVLNAANERVYSDGFRLSQRIWRLDQDSLGGIQRTVAGGIVRGESAWNLAGELEGYLGANADCPRWTSTRLFRLAPRERLVSRRGLVSRLGPGLPCASRGVAYNALRLARNEIQIAHFMATDAAFARAPWVEMEQIMLSPEHPPIGCECEDVVAGGENGEGVYAKGEITLPLHVQCMCYKVGRLMDPARFVEQLRGWMAGVSSWPEMDGYASWVGVDGQRVGEPGLLMSWGTSLATWLWGDPGALQGVLGLN